MMDALEYDLKCGEVWARSHLFAGKVRSSELSLRRMLTIAPDSYLALSFGKQSICLAHMLFHIAPETPMLFLSSWESFFLHDYERVIAEFTARWPINLQIVHRDNVSWNDLSWKETRDIGSRDIQEMDGGRYGGVIMGLSRDESFARRVSIAKNNTDWKTIYKYKNGRYRCTPIQHWKKIDLAAYISTHGIPLLSAYRQYGLDGRTTARITRNCAEMNGLVDLKNRDLEAYNRICERFPELSTKA